MSHGDDGSEAGGTGRGGTTSSAGTNSAGTKSSGGTSNSGGITSTGGKGGAPARCDAFGNESGPTILVQLTNGTQRQLYLGQRMAGCGLGSLFTVSDASGMALQGSQFCSSSCQDLALGSVPSCPPIACVVSSVVTLEPGESFTQEWHAAYVRDETLPAGCAPGSEGVTCSRAVAIERGTYTFSASAAAGMDCSQFGGGCSSCLADSNGACVTYGAVVTGSSLPVQASVLLDPSYGVGPANDVVPVVGLTFKE
jgi:hypothetical protein